MAKSGTFYGKEGAKVEQGNTSPFINHYWTPVQCDPSFRRWAGGNRRKNPSSNSTGNRQNMPATSSIFSFRGLSSLSEAQL